MPVLLARRAAAAGGLPHARADELRGPAPAASLEALEILMKEYTGTIVFITHDKRLLENVADVVYEIRDKKINLKH